MFRFLFFKFYDIINLGENMNLKNKGFTLVELLAVIVVVAIIMSIATLSITNFLGNSKDRVYLNYVATLKTTVEDYLIEDYENNGSLLPNVGGSSEISLNTLITKKKIDVLKDPNGGTCDPNTTKVVITRNSDKGINFDLSYSVYLVCEHAKITCNPYTKAKECVITKK